MYVKFLDLGRLHSSIRAELDAVWAETLDTSGFIGRGVSGFESAFGSAHGDVGAAACNSGTDALMLALKAAGLQLGDEIIVPSMTFAATAEAVILAGGVPVIADVSPGTLLISHDTVSRVRTDRTRGVVPVHLFGEMVPSEELKRLASDFDLVVEDAAQAHLATSEGSFPGRFTQAACFSFFPGKNLGAMGDAGAVISSDELLLRTVRQLRDHGRSSKYEHEVVGVSSRMDGLQAAILTLKLKHLAGWTAARRSIGRLYDEAFCELDGITPVYGSGTSARHLYPVMVDHLSRDALIAELDGLGVQTAVHYPIPLSLQPAYSSFAPASTPVAEVAAESLVSLPMDPLMSEGEVAYVIESVTAIAG